MSEQQENTQDTAVEQAVAQVEAPEDTPDIQEDLAPPVPEQAEPQTQTATPPAAQAKGGGFIWGTGRRKKAVARVRIRPGDGKFLINKREIDNFFSSERDRNTIITPLAAIEATGAWDVWVNVVGGGSTGQAGAISLGLARALVKALPDRESILRDKSLLTRDARMPERKKPGQPGARKRFQFSKR